MASNSGGADGVDPKVPLKYAKAGDISTEVFLEAGRAAGGGYVRLHEIAWHLSDYGVPETLTPAPDVSPYAVEQKARQLALRKVIAEAPGKEGLYLFPPADDAPQSR